MRIKRSAALRRSETRVHHARNERDRDNIESARYRICLNAVAGGAMTAVPLLVRAGVSGLPAEAPAHRSVTVVWSVLLALGGLRVAVDDARLPAAAADG
jgi:hypothetical protein